VKHAEKFDAALARLEGQVRGIRAMVAEGRYCLDILTQTRAAHAALQRVERDILGDHLKGCVHKAFTAGDAEDRDEKISEILQLFKWEGSHV